MLFPEILPLMGADEAQTPPVKVRVPEKLLPD
jgi:hypothetical protein